MLSNHGKCDGNKLLKLLIFYSNNYYALYLIEIVMQYDVGLYLKKKIQRACRNQVCTNKSYLLSDFTSNIL